MRIKGLNRAISAFLLGLIPNLIHSKEPAVSLMVGMSQNFPIGPTDIKSKYGTRVGLAFSSELNAGELAIPMEWGLLLRTTSIGFSDWYNRMVFTDFQLPIYFHGAPFWKPVEIMLLWTPSYTLDMVSTSPDAGPVSGTRSLRTRFNFGLGAGLQLVLPYGFRMRSHWVYNVFAPLPSSNLTIADWNFEIAMPFIWKKIAL